MCRHDKTELIICCITLSANTQWSLLRFNDGGDSSILSLNELLFFHRRLFDITSRTLRLTVSADICTSQSSILVDRLISYFTTTIAVNLPRTRRLRLMLFDSCTWPWVVELSVFVFSLPERSIQFPRVWFVIAIHPKSIINILLLINKLCYMNEFHNM